MIILESNGTNSLVEDAVSIHKGQLALSESKANPLSVLIAANEGQYYATSSDLEAYMEASHTVDPVYAIQTIAEANGIEQDDISIVVDEATAFTVHELHEAGFLLERAAEADATTLNKVQKWYMRFVSKSKDNATNAAAIKARLTVLKQCKANMEKALAASKSGEKKGKLLYALKNFIPFNAIFRLIKNDDVYAGIGLLSGMVVGTVLNVIFGVNKNAKAAMGSLMQGDVGGATDSYVKELKGAQASSTINTAHLLTLRVATYEKMLERMIKNTSEAIDFLEEKLKEIK